MRIIDGSADVCSSDHVILNTRNTSARRQEENFVMDGKKIALLEGALIIAIATAFMARSMFVSLGAPQATAANMHPLLDGPRSEDSRLGKAAVRPFCSPWSPSY